MRNRTEIEMKLMLIRHGSTKANREFRYLGTTDEELSEIGRQELLKNSESGMYPVPELLFSGPMKRCRQTAELLFPDMEYRCIPEWTEINFGTFEMKNHYELVNDPAYNRWLESNRTLPFPDGEGREEYIERIMCGFERMLLDVKPKENDVIKIAAVVHGGTIMALCSTLFEGDYFDYQVRCGQGFSCHFKYREDKQVELLEIKTI